MVILAFTAWEAGDWIPTTTVWYITQDFGNCLLIFKFKPDRQVRLDLRTMSWFPAPPLPSPRGWPGVAVLNGVVGDSIKNNPLSETFLFSSCTVLEDMTRETRH